MTVSSKLFGKRSLHLPRSYALLALAVNALILLVWAGNFFMGLRLRLNDFYFVPQPTNDQIVIVAIDDTSLNRYGSTPAEWSRAVFADFLLAIEATQPRVVAMDLLFAGPEGEDSALVNAITRIQQNETRTQVVIGTAGIQPLPSEQVRTNRALHYQNTLPLVDEIVTVADYIGFTNAIPDVDGLVRRQPSLVQIGIEPQLAWTFSIATYFAHLRLPPAVLEQVVTINQSGITLPGERHLVVDDLGLWQQNYFGAPGEHFLSISFAAVLDGTVEADTFTDKIVLVGIKDATASLDSYAVPASPSGQLMAGVEIQAHALNSILRGAALRPLQPIPTALLITIVTWLAALSLMSPRWPLKILIAGAWIFTIFVSGSLLFSTQGLVVNVFDPLLGIGMMLGVAIGHDISREAQRRQQTEFFLESIQQIARQRLNLARALPLIEQDIRRLIPHAEHIAIILAADLDGLSLEATEQSIVQQTYQTHALVKGGGVIAVPLLWQDKLQGVISIRHGNRDLTDQQERQLVSLADQLGPSLDNIALYQDLEREKQLVDTIYAEAPVGLALLDKAGRTIRHNQGVLELLAVEADQLTRKTFEDVIARMLPSTYEARQLQQALGEDRDALVNIVLGEQSLNVAITPLARYDLRVVILSDTSALTELNRLKTQMLRMASHDLKNPIARIVGFAELMRMDPEHLNETQDQYLGYIITSGHEMQHIIDDLLSLERLRSGEALFEAINLGDLIEHVIMSHQPDLIRKQQTFTYVPPETMVIVEGDTGQLSQAVTNLIGNAIKYTPEAGTITVRLQYDDEIAHFEVRDTGYGIPEKAQAKLFTEFYRAKSSATRHIPGTGLGLSLAKTVIERHGGTIAFESTEGVGSTFWINLPLWKANTDA